jgi:hypothetical protein
MCEKEINYKNKGDNMNIGKLLPFLKDNSHLFKVHCAIGRINKLEPLVEFSKGKFKEWQEAQNKENFKRNYILSLIFKSKGEWIFAGIYKSIGVKPGRIGNPQGFTYKTELYDIGKELIGRLIISFEKDFRASYLKLEEHIEKFSVCEIARNIYKIESFPGYSNVHITFDLLRAIYDEEEYSWKTALSNVKGIYLISDKTNGKLYVGSASGEFSFWNRWKQYVETGHGGNIALRELIRNNKYDYTNNFSFSILEICNINTMDDEIFKKESFWKEKLLTREFGYNRN